VITVFAPGLLRGDLDQQILRMAGRVYTGVYLAYGISIQSR
jgi:hypothetical protein